MRRQRYPTTYRSHSRASLSELLTLALERRDKDKFSERICMSVWGSSSSNSSACCIGGGAPSAGTKKVFAVGGWSGPGTIRRAAAFDRGEDRRRWANRKDARWKDVTFAGSRCAAVSGGETRACSRGVSREVWWEPTVRVCTIQKGKRSQY